MTANEMANEFEIGVDVITSLGAPGYTDEEISTILSVGQENLVKRKYTRDSNKLRKGYEGSEKRRKDLSQLMRTVVPTISASQAGVFPNGTLYDLPSNLLYVTSEHVVTDIPLCVDGVESQTEYEQVEVIPKTHDEYNEHIRDPFNKPSKEEVWRMDFFDATAKRHELITDGTFNISSYFVRYLKKPIDIVVDRVTPGNQVDSELDDAMHREIIQEAVRYAVSIMKPNEYQIKQAEQLQTE
jgi:hypothetical protein